MARMLSIIASTIRGSTGGLTYLSNQYHQIVVRARTAPVNPSTTNQGLIRSAFNYASNIWRSLTDAQRKDWNDYALTCVYPGPLGDYKVSGRSIFMAGVSLRQYLVNRGVAFAFTDWSAPVTPGFLPIVISPPEMPSSGIGYKVEVTNDAPEEIVAFCFRSFAFDGSRFRYKGPYLTEKLDTDQIASSAAGEVEYTDLVDEAVYFNRIRAISQGSPYRISAPVLLRAIAEPFVV